MDCATCDVRIRTEWFDLGPRDIACLNVAKERRSYATGETLYSAGDPCSGLSYVSAGLIRDCRQPDRSAGAGVLTLRHPGDVLGLQSFLTGSAQLTTATALQPSAVCFLSGQIVHALIARNPKAILLFVRRLAGSLDCAEEKLADQGADAICRRLVRLIGELRLAGAILDPKGEAPLDVPLTADELAAAVGTSPRALGAVLRRLQAVGILSVRKDAVRILDLARLQRAAHPAAQTTAGLRRHDA
ncbi:conserved hypothetical protein [uncultured Defluviicoccus sp.]|uniref:Crp/Fnr family transcriptional regulator n=1 Tax=metagenome TaxID=256318 RepID=A0A380TDC6_9ZZZZ|nr:conserved hypothetical protein [uncultured Defluviicoccus sp.]